MFSIFSTILPIFRNPTVIISAILIVSLIVFYIHYTNLKSDIQQKNKEITQLTMVLTQKDLMIADLEAQNNKIKLLNEEYSNNIKKIQNNTNEVKKTIIKRNYKAESQKTNNLIVFQEAINAESDRMLKEIEEITK
jgi:hypothetical protein